MRRAIPLALLVLLGLAAAPAARAESETASAGAVSATVTWTGPGPGQFTTRLSIERAGATLLDRGLRDACRLCAGAGPLHAALASRPSLRIVDLDLDGEPEVLLDLYSGGAHCCNELLVFALDASASAYTATVLDTGDLGYTLRDLNGDGRPEFASRDDRFAYAFSSYAESGFPARVFAYRPGSSFADVTRRFAAYIRHDLGAQSHYLAKARRTRAIDLRGLAASYAGDQCLLGHCAAGLRKARALERRGYFDRGPRAQFGPTRRHYLSVLRRFLRRFGYLN